MYDSNYLCHYGKKGMKWGYNDGVPNGKRQADVNDYKNYPPVNDVDAATKKDRKDSRTIKIERTASGNTEYGNYGPKLNSMKYDKKTGEKTYFYSKAGDVVYKRFTEKEKKDKNEIKHDDITRVIYTSDSLCHHGVPGMKWGRRKAKYTSKKNRIDRKKSRVDYKASKKQKTISKMAYKQIKGKEINEAKKAKLEKQYARLMNQSFKYAVKSGKYDKKIRKAQRMIDKYRDVKISDV